LAPGAELLEIGSYVGAFLDFARDSGCQVVGIDVNRVLSRYCRQRGHDVRNVAFSARLFHGARFDGVWILNCFEALPAPRDTLKQARDVLRPGGSVVIRTPNADFVTLAHNRGAPRWLRTIADANGLLGVPFRRCFSPDALIDFLRREGFEITTLRGREFASRVPSGSPPASFRRAAWTICSIVARRPLHPWLEVHACRAAAPRR
jgi:SAM-dependent methyltransferase